MNKLIVGSLGVCLLVNTGTALVTGIVLGGSYLASKVVQAGYERQIRATYKKG